MLTLSDIKTLEVAVEEHYFTDVPEQCDVKYILGKLYLIAGEKEKGNKMMADSVIEKAEYETMYATTLVKDRHYKNKNTGKILRFSHFDGCVPDFFPKGSTDKKDVISMVHWRGVLLNVPE